MKTPDEIVGLVENYVQARVDRERYHGNLFVNASIECDYLEAEIRAALTVSLDWQGMDSAPKDGTRILLCADGLSTVGFWIDEQEDQVDVMGADAGFVDVDYQNFWPGRSFGAEQYQGHGRQPTGWMPLPSPPAEGTVA